MIFFINSSFNEKNSGIEHAQLKRAFLFRNHEEPFKLVFREWNPLIHYYLSNVGIQDDETVGMFDYFQKATEFSERVISVKDLDFGISHLKYVKEEEEKRFLVFQEQQLVARVLYFTVDDSERVSSVEYFDGFGNLYRVDFYDFRGFISLVQWYTPDNKIGTEVWYDVYGQPVLETYNRYNARKKFVKTGWRLIEDNGAIYMFSNIEELTLYFLNKLNVEYWVEGKSNIFIMDRTHLADWALLNLEESAYTVLHLHNAHIGNAQDPKHAILNNFYEFSLTNGNGYDAIVSATEKQTKDIKERFSPTSQLYTIPVGINLEINLQEKK